MNERDQDLRKNIDLFVDENFPEESEIILFDGLERAFVGVGRIFTGQYRSVYDYDKCIAILCEDITEEDAIEYFEFNTVGAYVGEATPLIVHRFSVGESSGTAS